MKRTNGSKRTPRKVDYRGLLLDKRAELRSRLGLKFDSIASMDHVNEEDQAQMSHEEFVSLSLNGLEYEQLRQVDEALDRLDASEYGVCKECDEKISARRLQVVPWAAFCVPCQERAQAELDEGPPVMEMATL